jgi:membrane protease YdiL (CAAX protease family)
VFSSSPDQPAGQTAVAPKASLPRGRRLGFAFAVVLLATVMFVLNLVLQGLVGSPENPFAPTPALFVTVVLVESAWAAIIVWLVIGRIGGLSLAQLGWRAAPLGRNLVEGAVGFLVAAGLLLVMLGATGANPVVEAKAWILDASLADRALWLLIGIEAPFIEESVFRGMLQSVLVRKLGRVGGVLAMGVIFSLYHLPRGPIPFVGRFLLGTVFGVLRERTGGLVAPWVAHLLVWLIIGTR